MRHKDPKELLKIIKSFTIAKPAMDIHWSAKVSIRRLLSA